jgi:hypothetical protein
MTTQIDFLSDTVNPDSNINPELLGLDELISHFYNGDNTIPSRISCLIRLWDINPQECLECSNKICSMFEYTPTSMFRRLLNSIVSNNGINSAIRMECAYAIYRQDTKEGLQCLLKVYPSLDSAPLRVETLRSLIESTANKESVQEYLNSFVNDLVIECEYRYGALCRIIRDRRPYIREYIDEAFLAFSRNPKNPTRYRILSCNQTLSAFLTSFHDVKESVSSEMESILLGFCCDSDLDHNLRADASDILLRSEVASTGAKETAREVINLLGRENQGRTKNVYTNLENVHDTKIDESVNRLLLQIAGVTSRAVNGKFVDLSDVKTELSELIRDRSQSDKDALGNSLLRIQIDTVIHCGGQTLEGIFLKIWQIISEHTDRDQLRLRLVEELIDMANTCSSGHASRLVNVLSGFSFDGQIVTIDVGYRNQIQSNFVARISKMIRDIPDENKKSDILEEMITSGDIETKPRLRMFYLENIANIHSELQREFVTAETGLSADTFEEHFRSAMEFFESP